MLRVSLAQTVGNCSQSCDEEYSAHFPEGAFATQGKGWIYGDSRGTAKWPQPCRSGDSRGKIGSAPIEWPENGRARKPPKYREPTAASAVARNGTRKPRPPRQQKKARARNRATVTGGSGGTAAHTPALTSAYG